ncbi:hypothetical protein ACJVC5_02690 [Peredibacter sp. HCB2-198]|uniref:hypothetical protein n=1 Tax=Peredibacter sp. HCB2-198 TaxID=3383025 RepID=UPI0038B48F25
MKKLMTIPMLLVSLSAFAQKANVIFIDPDIESKELENFNIQKDSHQSSIPDRDEREALLNQNEKTKDWDELKKDIFYMDLARKSVPELQKKYPELTAKELKLLKERR